MSLSGFRSDSESTGKAIFLALSASVFCFCLSWCAVASAASSSTDHSLQVQDYQQDFGVSAEVAKRNLATQERGTGIVDQLEQAQGKRYAGVWFDNEAGEFVVPVVSGASRASVDSFGEAELGGDFRTKPVGSSWEELEVAHERIDEALLGLIEGDLIQTSLDPRTNAVVISEAEGTSATERAQIRAQAAKESVKVEVRSEDVKRFEAQALACTYAGIAWVCDKPMRGGVYIDHSDGSEGYCTAGFKATGNAFGNRFMLTAGHCVVNTSYWKSLDSGKVGHYLGHVEEASYPGSDYAKIKVTGEGEYWDVSPWPSEVAYWGGDQNIPINYESSSYLGESVCYSGAHSGSGCGTVDLIDKTTNYGAGPVYHLTEAHLDAQEGDSGGPVWTGNTALGLISGGIVGTGTTYYSEVTEATSAMGVTVGAQVGAPPYAETTPASSPVGVTQATGNGKVDPNGLSTSYHFDYGPTLAYGSSTQSWSAGSGWGTSSVSGTISGLQPLKLYYYRLVAENSAGTSYGVGWSFETTSGPPIATTEGVTGIVPGQAVLHGTVNPQGLSTTYQFDWGTQAEFEKGEYTHHISGANVGASGNDIAVERSMFPLKGLTTYHYRLVAENSKGKTTGADKAFTTPDWRPVVSIEQTNSAKAGKAQLHGTVNPTGFSTHYRFEWGTEAEFKEGKYNHLVPVPDKTIGSGESAVAVEQTMEGLKGETTYHYRLVAENENGKTTSADKYFKTPNWRPALFAEAVAVRHDKATLVAVVNPKGFDTHYHFEWGETAEYDHSFPVPDEGIGSGEKDVELSHKLEGLLHRQPYHYRVVAANVEGATYSSDQVFTTSESSFVGAYYPEELTGEGQGYFYPTIGIGAKCSTPNLSASQYAEAEELTVSMPDPACTVAGLSAPFEMHGCKLELHPGIRQSEKIFAGEIDIGPPGCGPIVFKGVFCESTIAPQVGQKASFENVGNAGEAAVMVKAQFQSLRYTEIAGGACNGGSYEPGVTQYGTLEASWRMRGKGGTTGDVHVEGPYAEPAPGATTKAATGIGVDHATANGSVNPRGVETTYRFDYGTTAAYGSQTSLSSAGKGTTDVAVNASLSGLKANTLYHFRVVALNPGKTVFGKDETFTTTAWQPAVTTEAAGEVKAEGATLHATVNPGGIDTHYQFEYGRTIAYGTSAPVPSEDVGNGSSGVAVSQAVKGLEAGTKYHFRAVSTSSEGTVNGKDLTFTTPPAYQSSFGSSGTGNGQFAHPAGSALDSGGNLWVVDENNKRVEKFNEKGEYLTKFGSSGTGNGQFTRPTDVAIDAKGNLWVTDAGNSRVEEFNEKGEYLTKFGSSGTGNGQFASGGPEAITIDSKGNLWVADTLNGRLQKFNEKGEFVKVVSSKGSGAGQLGEPTGIDIGLKGNVWVADWQYNRVVEFNEAGEYVRQFGSEGTGNGQFKHPDVVEVDSKGEVWVGDQNNNRVQEFNEAGEYVAQFGTAGSGAGQFGFSYPIGITTDTKGDIWVSDPNNNRVQKWLIANYVVTSWGFSVSPNSEGPEFHSEVYPATIGGEQSEGIIGEKTFKKIEIKTAAGAVKCSSMTFSSSTWAPGGLITDTSSLLLFPTFGECSLAGISMIVTVPAGCVGDNFTITGGPPYVGSMYMCKLELAVQSGECKIIVPGQTHSGMEYANVGVEYNETVEAKANLSGVEYQIVSKTCPNETKEGSYSDGAYKGVMKLKVTKVN